MKTYSCSSTTPVLQIMHFLLLFAYWIIRGTYEPQRLRRCSISRHICRLGALCRLKPFIIIHSKKLPYFQWRYWNFIYYSASVNIHFFSCALADNICRVSLSQKMMIIKKNNRRDNISPTKKTRTMYLWYKCSIMSNSDL